MYACVYQFRICEPQKQLQSKAHPGSTSDTGVGEQPQIDYMWREAEWDNALSRIGIELPVQAVLLLWVILRKKKKKLFRKLRKKETLKDEILALVVLLCLPAPSQASFHPCPFFQVCVFELCTPAAATFQCLNSHWFLHSRQPNQVHDLTLSTVPESQPIGSHFCMRNLVFGMFFSESLRQGSLPHPTPYTHALLWLEPQGKGNPQQRKLVCVVSFFCVFVCLCETCSCWTQLCL